MSSFDSGSNGEAATASAQEAPTAPFGAPGPATDPLAACLHALAAAADSPLVRRILVVLWTAPTTLFGMPFVAAALLGGGRVRKVQGVLEVHGPLIEVFLRRCALHSGGALAMTLGHVVIGRSPKALSDTRAHERVHVRQAETWGPLFIPAYLIASVVARFETGRWYADNRFEVEARALSDDIG